MKRNAITHAAIAGGISVWLLTIVAGCPSGGPSATGPSGAAPPASGEHVHDHGHGHEDTGPHGGHVVELGDEQLHAEWTHNDSSGEVTVYLLDESAKEDVVISAATISITTTIGENETTYELAAVSPENGQSSRFAVTDPSLVEALKAVGPGIEATIAVLQNEQPLVGKFQQHSHGGHQH